MRRSIPLVLAGTAVGAATQVAGATPAGADLRTCDPGEWCIYEDQDYNADSPAHEPLVHMWTGNADNYNNHVWFNAHYYTWSGRSTDNSTSSVKNNGRSCAIDVFEHPGRDGDYTFFARGTSDPWLNNNDVGNDRASSHQWTFCQ